MAEPYDMNSLDYTYSFDKYSCVRNAWYFHIAAAYAVTLTGIAAMVLRLLPPRWAHYHVWAGRGYVMSMLWCTATQMLIHNSGLPVAVLLSFIWVLGGLTLGWIAINFAQVRMHNEALARLTARGHLDLDPRKGGLAAVLGREKGAIAAGRSYWQRVFSLKTLHAVLLFTSWINIVGRIFASNQSGDFVCETYPFFKNVTSSRIHDPTFVPGQPVPLHNPNYSKLPWFKTGLDGWGVALSLGPLAGGFLVGMLFIFVTMRKAQRDAVIAQQTPPLVAMARPPPGVALEGEGGAGAATVVEMKN